MIRVIPIMLFALVAALLLGALLDRPPTGGLTKAEGPLIDQPMPTLPLVDAENRSAPFTPEAGTVTVVNFLASWCSPCAAEMGELVALKADAEDVHFVGVAWNDAPITIAPWLKEHGDPFDAMRYDPGGRGAIALGMRGIPETYIIDATGIIRYQLRGPLTAAVREREVAPLLNQLLAEAADAR